MCASDSDEHMPEKCIGQFAYASECSSRSVSTCASSKVDGHSQGGFATIDANDLVMKEMIGSGSTYEVFMGHLCGEMVAIKRVISGPYLDTSGPAFNEYTRELSVLKELLVVEHPNLVRFLGCTIFSHGPCIVNEFCEGGDLFELLHMSDHIEISWQQRLVMCAHVAQGMSYLHGANPQIIHRDLKSSNLLLMHSIYGPKDKVMLKVSDFGLSKLVVPGAEPSKMTADAGTLLWMAPEILCSSDSYDEKVDVYSFAIILFELAFRILPFDDEESPSAITDHVINGNRPDIEDVSEHCPGVIVQLMIDCWSHDPAKRPSFTEVSYSLGARREALPFSL